MRKYLECFINGFDSTITEKVKPENGPYVGYDMVSDEIVFTIVPTSVVYDPYVTFTAEADNSFIGLNKLSTNQTLEYSTDTTNWNTFDTETNIFLNNGDKLYVRGILSSDNTPTDYTQFIMTGKIVASGNCNAIWNYQDLNAPLKTRCGHSMFSDCKGLITAPVLPATTLAEGCYARMFFRCQSLTTVPEILPAKTVVKNCYNSMLKGCTSLTIAPELPAMTLAEYCYFKMFSNTNLNHITCLATDISAYNCTTNWVDRVSSTGTFIKHPDMTGWTTGESGIPSGWKVEDAEL